MPQPILALGMRFEVQKTLSSSVSITGITLASPGVVTTAAAHGFANGDVVVLTVPAGMTQLDGQACRISAASGSTFTLEGLDTSQFSASQAGATVRRIATFDTFSGTTSFSAPVTEPTRIDITTLEDFAKQEMFGLDEAQRITLEGFFDSEDVALVTVRAASRAKAPATWRVTFPNGRRMIFNSFVAGGENFSAEPGQPLKSTVNITPIKTIRYYAS